MEDRVGDFYFQNGIRKRFIEKEPETGSSHHKLYEVLRIISGIPLFMDDHVKRLNESVKALAYSTGTLEEQLKENLNGLIRSLPLQEGNVILICTLMKQEFDILCYAIPHKYPESSDYRSGVNLASFKINRPDPNFKQVSVSDRIKNKLKESLNKENLYEVLLVNEQGRITEGSRSNFFLVKDQCLYTAPDEEVLKGITRKYVLRIARRAGIACKFISIPFESISEYHAAFICGTSPMILPVKMINDVSFDSQEITIRKLMELYKIEIENYIAYRL